MAHSYNTRYQERLRRSNSDSSDSDYYSSASSSMTEFKLPPFTSVPKWCDYGAKNFEDYKNVFEASLTPLELTLDVANLTTAQLAKQKNTLAMGAIYHSGSQTSAANTKVDIEFIHVLNTFYTDCANPAWYYG